MSVCATFSDFTIVGNHFVDEKREDENISRRSRNALWWPLYDFASPSCKMEKNKEKESPVLLFGLTIHVSTKSKPKWGMSRDFLARSFPVAVSFFIDKVISNYGKITEGRTNRHGRSSPFS